MDTSFDLVALLRQQPTATKSHKIRPTQFVSVAGGVQKRLETNIKNRKSSRLSVFDRIRNIEICQSPQAPALSDTQQKALHRKQQLEKYKDEKNKKKKEAAAQKKKPFVSAIPQRKTFGPPPPPRPMPSTSGRMTRSQARQKVEPKPSNTQKESFAPTNAVFKPSIFLNTAVPKLAPLNKKKASKSKPSITFEPVLRKNVQKETRPAIKTTRVKPVGEIKTRNPIDKTKVNAKTTTITLQKPPPLKQHMFQSSSSSSETEQPKLRKKPSLCKTELPQESTSQNSACVLRDASNSSADTVSMKSQEHNSQDTASISSHAFDSQDNATVIEFLGTVSMSSQDELSTPRNKVPKSESSSEEKLRSPKPWEQIIEEAKKISPNVTILRGKDNARKETKKKLLEGLLDEDNSNMDDVNHFRRQLESEIARLTATCETWDQVFAQTVLPEPVQELVLTALGQARLLMAEKLQQFAGLIDSCANPTPGAPLVTPADLHGFWDMVFIQVANVAMLFKSLEELRLRDWIEEQKPLAASKKLVAKQPAKKVVSKPRAGPSRLKDMIAAARKVKKEQESQSENSESNKSEPTASPDTKTFEGVFFRVSSPLKRSPAPATPSNKTSLLKTVLSSEANKSISKQNSPFFSMLRASWMSKNVEIDGVATLMQTPTVTPVNLFATPARSILKLNPISTKKTDKAKKTVLFHETDEPSSPTSYTSCEVELGVAPLPADDKENKDTPKKEATRRRSRLSRQYAQDLPSPVMTRNQRKSVQTPLLEADANVEVKKRSTRKPKGTGTPAQETETPKRCLQTPPVEADADVEVKKRSTRRPKGTGTPAQETETPKRCLQTPPVEADADVEVKKRSTRRPKSTGTPAQETETPKRCLQTPPVEADADVEVKKRSTRRPKSTGTPAQETETPKRCLQTPPVEADADVEVKKRSTKKPKDTGTPAQETETPKRKSSRRRKSAAAV